VIEKGLFHAVEHPDFEAEYWIPEHFLQGCFFTPHLPKNGNFDRNNADTTEKRQEITEKRSHTSLNNTALTSTSLTTTTEAANEVFPYTSGTLNQIVKFPPIDWSGVGISSTVNFRLARTDSNAGDVYVTFVDGHVEIDSDGSNQEYVK